MAALRDAGRVAGLARGGDVQRGLRRVAGQFQALQQVVLLDLQARRAGLGQEQGRHRIEIPWEREEVSPKERSPPEEDKDPNFPRDGRMPDSSGGHRQCSWPR